MKKNRPKKGKKNIRKEEEGFSKIGDVEQVKSLPNPIIQEKTIIYDGNQYSCKIPKSLMKEIDYQKGDKLKFILSYPKDKLKNPTLKIEYVGEK